MDDWKKFRPASDLKVARQRQRRIRLLLGLATALFFATLIGRLLKPHIVDALTYAKAALRLPREELPILLPTDSDKRAPRSHRKHRNLAPKPRFSRTPEPGPFDAYILNGDRYLRVEGMSDYALLDTRTGEVIWIKEPQ
jgi:hypothetical protein